MTRLEKYLVATATEIIEAETTVSRYFVIGNVKVRVSDHLSKRGYGKEKPGGRRICHYSGNRREYGCA